MDQRKEVKYILERLNVGIFNQLPPKLVEFNFDSVIKLNLRGKGITELPIGIFDRLPSLQYLDLAGNYITHIPNRIFDQLTSLKMLNLQYNQISELANDTFHNLANLEELTLHNNQLQYLPDDIFTNLIYLQMLNLANNQLHNIPRSLKTLPNLEWLDLTKNKLEHGLNKRVIIRKQVKELLSTRLINK